MAPVAAAVSAATSHWGTRYFLYTPLDSPTERDFKDMLLTNPLPFAWMSCRPTHRAMYGAILEAAKYMQGIKRVHGDEHADGEHLLLEISCVRAPLPPKDWQTSAAMIDGATFQFEISGH
jgi:hypothetical protein